MSKIISSTKLISLIAFVCVAAVFYYFMIADSGLIAANKIVINEDKGMTVEEFQKRISQPDKLVLVYFNASWCVPCIKLKPVIMELEKKQKLFARYYKLILMIILK